MFALKYSETPTSVQPVPAHAKHYNPLALKHETSRDFLFFFLGGGGGGGVLLKRILLFRVLY